jgi:putative ABC transport system ATP-binding protein
MKPVPTLHIQQLRFRWPGQVRDCLQIDQLHLSAGGRLLVRGDSGCGKSTLLSLAAGVMLTPAGQISLLGQDWRSLSAGQREQWRADHVGYLFQQFNLLTYLSPIDNVLLPCRLSTLRSQRCQGQAAEQARDLLQALGIGASLWHRPSAQLSVGQQQRVAAARALIGQPELVIADEPTSALDERRRDEFMQLLLRQCERVGSALLFVTHDRRLSTHFDQVLDLPGPVEQEA